MKYIRTDEGIYEFKEECMSINKGIYYLFGKLEETSTDYLFKNDVSLGKVIKQADTIEELCDEFVLKTTSKESGESYYGLYYYSDIKRFKVKEGFKGVWYGAIWTDKGLIYVAKMNEKGELKCL